MIGTGLALPSPQSTAAPSQPGPPPGSALSNVNMSVGGVTSAQSLGSTLKMKAASLAESQGAADDAQAQPGVIGIAGEIKSAWTMAVMAKRDTEIAMLEALYARRGEYTAEKLSQIQAAGQPAIYMMLAASKMRQAESLLRDVLIGSGTEKPWSTTPEPVSDLPPSEVSKVAAAVSQEFADQIFAGQQPTLEDVRQRLLDAKEELTSRMREEAAAACQRMEDKMETQLDDGGFNQALDAFITDLCTFKTAWIAGPIVRNKPKLTWSPGVATPVVKPTTSLEWERVDPFEMYPAPWARSIDDGPLIRKHKLTRQALTEMLGVDGFDDDSIKRVLDLYGDGGLHDWLTIDTEKARAEGKTTIAATMNNGLIDALQFWGSVSGKMLREWGMKPKQVPDESKEYQVEAWMIGTYVIKCVLNSDPLARRPFYSTSYERIPGSVWGNSPYDLMRDSQDMCNASARSLAANLGISSGPQVVVNVSRLPTGETISQMYPWKIWQVEEDPMGNVAPPITFFQPSSNAAELMGVFQKFSDLADEYTGIPKYMSGQEGTPGAGRTASGLSMMIGNASKIIKQIVGSVDMHILTPLLDRLYYYNMRYATDPDLKGAARIKARGAMSLTTKDSTQQRRSEFLQATNNPTDMSIIGLPGRAEILRASARTLDLNTDKIVPTLTAVKAKQAQVQQQQVAQAAEAQGQGTPGTPGTPGQSSPGGTPANIGPQNGQPLQGGHPMTDTFSPAPQGA